MIYVKINNFVTKYDIQEYINIWNLKIVKMQCIATPMLTF